MAKDRKTVAKVADIMINRFHFRKGFKKVGGKSKRGYVRSH